MGNRTVSSDGCHLHIVVQVLDGSNKLLLHFRGHLAHLAHLKRESWHDLVVNLHIQSSSAFVANQGKVIASPVLNSYQEVLTL